VEYCWKGKVKVLREKNYTSANLSTTNPTYPQDCDFLWHSFMFCCHKHSDTHIKYLVTVAKQFLLVARSSLWERHTTKFRAKDYRQKRWKYERKCRVQIIRLSEHRCCCIYIKNKIIWHSADRASWCILIMKANEMRYFPYLFDKVLYMFRICPLSIIRSISTLYTRNRYLSC